MLMCLYNFMVARSLHPSWSEAKTNKGRVVRKHQLQYLRSLRCADPTSFAMRVEPLGVPGTSHQLLHGTICLPRGIL